MNTLSFRQVSVNIAAGAVLPKLRISVSSLAKLGGKAEATAGDDAADTAWFTVSAEDGPQTLTLVFPAWEEISTQCCKRTVAVWLLTMP